MTFLEWLRDFDLGESIGSKIGCHVNSGLPNSSLKANCEDVIKVAAGLRELYEFLVVYCRRRAGYLFGLIVVVAGGLALRKFGYQLHLPFVIVKYGASALWGAMVYFLLALLIRRANSIQIALIAMLVSTGIELFRLYHIPSLDQFRLTTAGALLLGRIFSFWNIVSYTIGIATAMTCSSCRPRGLFRSFVKRSL